MNEPLPQRPQAYLDLLARGLVLLRDSAHAGRIDLCRIEADHLHNVPSLLAERNEGRHEYYIRGERGLYLARLQEIGAEDYLAHVGALFSDPWRILADVAGHRPSPEARSD